MLLLNFQGTYVCTTVNCLINTHFCNFAVDTCRSPGSLWMTASDFILKRQLWIKKPRDVNCKMITSLIYVFTSKRRSYRLTIHQVAETKHRLQPWLIHQQLITKNNPTIIRNKSVKSVSFQTIINEPGRILISSLSSRWSYFLTNPAFCCCFLAMKKDPLLCYMCVLFQALVQRVSTKYT